MAEQLVLPEGINYECTSCGKCCGGWAVPLTQDDYERISSVDWSAIHPSYKDKQLFRELKKTERENTPYSYKINSETGVCPFLVDNLCFIHSKEGAEFKPSICQLFPYCFSETPSGVYATVSFVSLGAIYNSGKPLAEQKDAVEHKWKEFRKLYPTYSPDWSKIKLTVDQPITWDEYMKLEAKMLELLRKEGLPLEVRMLNVSEYLNSKVRKPGTPPGTPIDFDSEPMYTTALYDLPLKSLDIDLLMTFHKMYYPTKQLKVGEGDFHVMRLLKQKFTGSKRLQVPGDSYSLGDLHRMVWPEEPEINGILERYIYSYIFGKKYFGAGFGQVSVIAGFHHLIMILALIKLHSKAAALMRKASSVNVLDVAATVRQMERQVGESKLGGYAAAAWELFLFPPGRAKRYLSNV